MKNKLEKFIKPIYYAASLGLGICGLALASSLAKSDKKMAFRRTKIKIVR